MQSSYFEADEKSYYVDRLKILTGIIFTFFLIMAFSLIFIQLVRGTYYRKASRENSRRIIRDQSCRGSIFDRYGRTIVENKIILNLFFNPGDVKKTAGVIESLSHVLSIPKEKLIQKLKSGKTFSYEGILIKEGLSLEEAVKISEQNFKFPGVYIKEGVCRNYPEKTTAAHAIGYPDYSGIELEYDHYLRGRDGGREIEIDAKGNLQRLLMKKEPTAGVDIRLTIDRELQKKAEGLLEGKAGAIVCLDPRNGEIFAIASAPVYEPAVFAEKRNTEIENLNRKSGSPLLNRALQGRYAPGSTFKVITAGAFLEEKLGSENTHFNCTGSINMGRTFSCWEKDGHGNIGFFEGMAYSCDVYFYNLGLKVGVDRLSRYAMACRLGKKTGVDLPYEEKGFVPTRSWKENFFRILSQKRWYPGETIVMSIGQGYLTVTPLQMAVLYGAIAIGGDIYRPRLVRTIGNGAGFESELLGPLPFSPQTISSIKRGLFEVVHGHGASGGTGTNARVSGINSAGKTGTSQVVGSDSFNQDNIPARFRDHAWFCGFAPYENPEIVAVVLVEHGGSGAGTAAPIFKTLMEFYFSHAKNKAL